MSRALLSLTVAFRRGDVHAAWFLLALLVFFAPSASAQNWEEILPDMGTAPVRIWAGSAYDPVSNRLIVFGGAAPVPGICLGFCPATSDVFVLTNANGLGGLRDWIQLAPTGGPPPERFSPVVGYDSVSNRLIVSGGLGPVDPNTNTAFRTDTWVLTNANGLGGSPEWIEPGEPGSDLAPPRVWSGSAYDPATNRLIVFGGKDGTDETNGLCIGFTCSVTPATSDVFVLSNANGLGAEPTVWTQLAPTGGPPPERFSPVVGYDSVSNRLIVSGGLGPVDPNTNTAFRTDTWVLTNANGLGGSPEWIEPGEPGSDLAPPRVWSGSAYDPATNRLIVFGGKDGTDETNGLCIGFTCSVTPATSDVFVLSNANGLGGLAFWTQLAPTGGPPPERFSPVVEHDSATNRLMVFGGVGALDPNTGTGFRTDSWVLILESLELNQPPVAEAGSPQTVQSIGPEGAPVTLDGSGSSDPDGDALTFTWTGPFPEGGGTVTGVTPTVTLPVGLSVITLVVNDGALDSAPDNVPVIVFNRVEGLLAPLASLRPEAQPPIFPDRAFKQGRTLPLKLQLFCGSTLLTDADVPPPEIVSLVRLGDAIDLETVDLDAGEANDSGFLFRFSGDKWVYNLSTAGLSSGTYTISIRMPDGFNRRTGFVLK